MKDNTEANDKFPSSVGLFLSLIFRSKILFEQQPELLS